MGFPIFKYSSTPISLYGIWIEFILSVLTRLRLKHWWINVTPYILVFFTHYVGSVFFMRQQWLYDSAIFNRSLPKLLNRLEYYWLRSYFYIHTVGEGVRWWYAIFGAKSQRPTCWTFYSWISNCVLNGHSCTNLLSLSRLFTM